MDFDPNGIREIARQAKAALRRRLRAVRQALPPSAVAERSQRIVQRLVQLDTMKRASHVGLYWPIAGRGEVDVRPLDSHLRSQGKYVYYPFMDPTSEGFRTGFRLVADPNDLAKTGQPFREPPRDAPEAQPGELSLIVVPALAAAPTGHRLGHGSGFYDATLPEHCPPGIAVVVVHHFQLLAELPQEAHDQPASVVITDETTLHIK